MTSEEVRQLIEEVRLLRIAAQELVVALSPAPPPLDPELIAAMDDKRFVE